MLEALGLPSAWQESHKVGFARPYYYLLGSRGVRVSDTRRQTCQGSGFPNWGARKVFHLFGLFR